MRDQVQGTLTVLKGPGLLRKLGVFRECVQRKRLVILAPAFNYGKTNTPSHFGWCSNWLPWQPHPLIGHWGSSSLACGCKVIALSQRKWPGSCVGVLLANWTWGDGL